MQWKQTENIKSPQTWVIEWYGTTFLLNSLMRHGDTNFGMSFMEQTMLSAMSTIALLSISLTHSFLTEECWSYDTFKCILLHHNVDMQGKFYWNIKVAWHLTGTMPWLSQWWIWYMTSYGIPGNNDKVGSDTHLLRKWHVAWSAPSHYLNQCWHIVNWSFRNILQWIIIEIHTFFVKENIFKNIVGKMVAILSCPNVLIYRYQ